LTFSNYRFVFFKGKC